LEHCAGRLFFNNDPKVIAIEELETTLKKAGTYAETVTEKERTDHVREINDGNSAGPAVRRQLYQLRWRYF
jgi:hypothetical protein